MFIKDRKINIGVVGCGKIAANHFKAITALKDAFNLLAVCDTFPQNLQQTTTRFNAVGYTNLETMLIAQPELDVITLCSPSGLHAQQTMTIASHNKHVITEKPMATRWQDGLDMVRACDNANVQLFVVKQNRYQPALQQLKAAIDKNRFGKIYLVNLNVFWTRPQSYYDQASWRGTWEFDGGAFMNQASHYVDLLAWLFGPVQSIQAMMATLAIHRETEDTGVLNIRWRSGTLGSMCVTMLTYPKNLEASLTILGEKGSVKIGGLSANQILHWEFAERDVQDDTVATLSQLDTLLVNGHEQYYQNVQETLQGKAHPHTDGREGLRSLEILIAAYLSARDNKHISLPLIY